MAQGAALTFSVRLYGALLAYFTQLYLARTIGAEQLGIYVFAWTWLSILAFLTPVGFDTSLVRYIAAYLPRAEWGELRGVVRTGFRVTLLSSLVAAAVGLTVVAIHHYSFGGGPYTTALVIALAALPVVALVNLHEGIARGFTWVAQVGTPSFGVRPTFFLLGAALVIHAFDRPAGPAVMVAMVGASLITFALQHWAYRRALPAQVVAATTVTQTRTWFRGSAPMMLVASFELMLTNTDVVMLGWLRGPADTGVYNIAVRTAGVLLLFFFAICAFAAPKIAALYAGEDRPGLIAFSSKVRWWISLPTLAGALGLLLVGNWLLGFFGLEFEFAYQPMLILMTGVVFRALAGPVDNLLTMTGKQTTLASILAGVMLLNIVTNAILIPRYGASGAATATATSVILEVTLVSVFAGRHIGFRPFLFLK